MPLPRADNPQKKTLYLGALTVRQIAELQEHVSAGRRSIVSQSEVVEMAVAQLHSHVMATATEGGGGETKPAKKGGKS